MGRSADGRGAWMACCSWVGSVSGAGQGPETVSQEGLGSNKSWSEKGKNTGKIKWLIKEKLKESPDEMVNTFTLSSGSFYNWSDMSTKIKHSYFKIYQNVFISCKKIYSELQL